MEVVAMLILFGIFREKSHRHRVLVEYSIRPSLLCDGVDVVVVDRSISEVLS